MYRAVHADRAGRVIVSDHAAAAFDGAATVPFSDAVRLPTGATVMHIEREAETLDRSARARRVGPGRLAVAAILPPGFLRTQLPAYADAPDKPDLTPRGYTAVAADDAGDLVVAALLIDRDPTHDVDAYPRAEIAAKVNDALRSRPADRLVRQLARCAREYSCRAAANAFYRRWECALPVAAPANEHPPAAVAPRLDGEAEPREPAAFHATAEEIATLAIEHIAAGGTLLSFGRACEGEPLLVARLLEDAMRLIRAATRSGTIHLETNGSAPAALRRLATTGLDAVAIRLMSARPDTYETLHRPEGYRFADVRASVRVAAEQRLATSLLIPVLPGVFDRTEEIAALVALADELPEGSAVLMRDLAADPLRALAALKTRDTNVGVARALERLREELPHLRVGAFVRPLARI
ncbi:MAG TPA: radical SAM protein [Candidatus Limnocylindria bacterium]|nr:radical SAM protein [Candidatus Limnocylindria bacterium]